MTEAEALRTIRGLAGANRVTYTRHARERMRARSVTDGDVLDALGSATQALLQDNGAWRVAGGVDRDGDALVVVVALEDNLLVITVF